MTDIIKSTEKFLDIPRESMEDITKLHKKVSSIKTPKNVIKPGYDGNDYIELWYMKKIADEFYPGWSWIPEKTEFIYQKVPTEITETITRPISTKEGFSSFEEEIHKKAVLVDVIVSHITTGVLIWHEHGVWRKGFASAGHAVQMLKDKRNYVNLGHDTKSSNTSALRKAFNTYLNIGDDVYKNEDVTLSEEQIETMLDMAKKAGLDVKEVRYYLEQGQIHAGNYDKKLANLKEQIKEKSNARNTRETKKVSKD